VSSQPFPLSPIEKARFVRRPNRFLVHCRARRLGEVQAFLPNPGRLWELLLPGASLYLTPSAAVGGAQRPVRKTPYTVLAVERDNAPILLHTHLANQTARFLIEQQRIPELAGVEIVRAEVPVGNSRFDFLLRRGGREVLLEVKSCTLFGNQVAMFPDAQTERGRRHLLELAKLGRPGAKPIVLFLVHTDQVRWFLPDYHTDLDFSQTLLEVRKKLQILPLALRWTSQLELAPDVKTLEIPWPHLQRQIKDQGSYLLLLALGSGKRIEVGRLGAIRFRKGWYLYVGSARGNLSARIARHARPAKTLHWHIDYLRREADAFVSLPIRSSQREECEIARAAAETFAPGPPHFGSSDCRCPTHLFWSPQDPLQRPAFHALLQRFRMRPPRSRS
jgi:sugar fermentation stimulation protein A